jgi:DNA-binding NarL/FixJ family response regulator
MAEPRVMIVEDEVIVAEGLRRSLEASGFAVVGSAMDAREALQMARELHPDVILMDVFLPGAVNGIEAARAIQRLVDTSIIYVTAQSSDTLVRQAVQSGAFGYIVKPFQARQVTSSIEIALSRREEARLLEQRASFAAPSPPREDDNADPWQISGRATAHREAGGPFQNDGPARAVSLIDEDTWDLHGSGVTQRERQVIRGLVCYRRLARVAEELGISVHTARNHLKSVFRKLNLHSQDQLLRFLLEGEEP